MNTRVFPGTALALVLFVSASTQAQQPPPPPVPNPQAPNLNPVAPLGMQRGTKLELTLTGTNLADPTGLWTSFPSKAVFPTDMNNGKDNAKLRVQLEVPADAPLGFHTLRLATTRGMSNFRVFTLDDLTNVMEVDTNRARGTAQAVTAPCVVSGRADAEAADFFKVTVKAGQRLTFEILGRRLGSAFDPQISLYNKNGREMPAGFNLDAPGLQTDARLTYTFKEAGDYTVEVRDVQWRGGPDFFYRLRIGDFPCATTPLPLAVQRGVKTTVNFAGTNLEGVAPVEVTAPADPTVSALWIAPKGSSGQSGWPVLLAISDTPESNEVEPNNEAAKATKITAPCGVTGRFLEKGDVDYYVFNAKKGQRFIIDAQTFELNSPADVYLVLRDVKAAQLAVSNPDVGPRIDFTVPADGDYTIVAEHLHFSSGPEETYHLTVLPYEPGFDLSVQLDRWDAPQAGTFNIPILLTRRDYQGAIDVSVVGTGLSGTVQIPTFTPPPKPPNVPAATLTITIAENAPVGPLTFTIQGKATVNMKPVVRLANYRALVTTQMAALPFPPPQFETPVAVAVKARPPFMLSAKFDAANVEPGKPITATITANRAPGFAEEIVLNATGLPATVKATLKNIAKGQNDVKIPFEVAPTAVAGTFPITFSGKAKAGMVEISGNASPASLVVFIIPFELKVEPTPLPLQQGAKAKLKVTATRNKYAGVINLAVMNLPAGVTAGPAVLAANVNTIEIELTAAATATLGDKANVNVVGTAPAPVNYSRPSPNVTVGVLKK